MRGSGAPGRAMNPLRSRRLAWALGLCVGTLSAVASAAALLEDHPAIFVVGGLAAVLVVGILVEPRLRRDETAATETAGPDADETERDSVPGLRFWLPRGDGPLIGREAMVETVAGRLERESLVTLVGAGGSGKTQVAIAVADRLKTRFGDRVSFVELLPVEPGQPIVGAIARQLDVPLVPRVDDMETLKGALSGREMLLVVDNCEHVVDEAAATVGELLTACPDLRVLATSRAALGLAREGRVEVEPLALPALGAGLDEVAASPAITMFVDRARRVSPTFDLTAATYEGVVAICRAVDGLPYALVLIAARLGEQHLNDVLRSLDASLLTLQSGPDEQRHRETLAATIGWSVRLMAPDEGTLFRRVAVYAGSFDVEGAHAVAPELARDRVRDGLVALCRASLIHLVPDQDSTRYRLLEVARTWGREAMEAAERHDAERAHARHMRTVVGELAPRLRSRERLSVLARLDAEYDDVVAALSWCREHSPALGRRIAGELSWYWGFRGLLKEGSRWLDVALGESPERDDLSRAELLWGAGNLAFVRGEFGTALAHLREAARVSEAVEGTRSDDAVEARRLRGYVLTVIAMSEASCGRYAPALDAAARSRALFESLGDDWGLALATNDTGSVLRYAGDRAEAARFYERSLAMWEATGDPWGISLTLSNLAIVAVADGRPDDARQLIGAALPHLEEDGAGKALSELILGDVARLTGDDARARDHYRESLRQNRAIDRRTVVAECLDRLGLLAAATGAREDAALLFGAGDAYREANDMAATGAAFPSRPGERERERLEVLGSLDDDPALLAAYARGRELDPEVAAAKVDVSAVRPT